jgi:SAM-dependent MidA family methyltransferase
MLQMRHPKLLNRLVWLDELPSVPIEGVILANEVLDALPVHRLCYRKHVAHELLVGTDDAGFIWRESEAGFMPEQMLPYSELVGELPDAYITEYNSMLPPFIESLSATLGVGAILLIDYGYPRREYYHPQRIQGTLACYYRHRQHDNPFVMVGLQDITASVDFTQVAEAAHASGFEICGFTTQSGFLVSSGLEKIISDLSAGNDQAMLRYNQQAGKLILPGEMGETFKVMALGKNIRVPLIGFSFGSHLHRL